MTTNVALKTKILLSAVAHCGWRANTQSHAACRTRNPQASLIGFRRECVCCVCVCQCMCVSVQRTRASLCWCTCALTSGTCSSSPVKDAVLFFLPVRSCFWEIINFVLKGSFWKSPHVPPMLRHLKPESKAFAGFWGPCLYKLTVINVDLCLILLVLTELTTSEKGLFFFPTSS